MTDLQASTNVLYHWQLSAFYCWMLWLSLTFPWLDRVRCTRLMNKGWN